MPTTPIKRNILLNPGPATTTDTVKWAQVIPDVCPREKSFGDVMEECAQAITQWVGSKEDYTTVFFGGSGTAAVEAILSSVIPHGGKVLVVNNGAYGERMQQITDVYGIQTVVFSSSPVSPLDMKGLEEVVKNEEGLTHLAVVHHETTTGLLNDIAAVGRVCVRYGLSCVVDAMSSFAAIPIDMRAMNIDYLAASSNKNVQGMAGISWVIGRKQAILETKAVRPRSLYLNLFAQYDYFERTHQTRFTPPVQTFYALRQAIREANEETLAKRYARYSRSWETLIQGLEKFGLTYLIDKPYHSKLMTSILEPPSERYDFEEMHNFFLKKGFTIYPGKVNDYPTFRISNIGQIDEKDIKAFLAHLRAYLTGIGYFTHTSS